MKMSERRRPARRNKEEKSTVILARREDIGIQNSQPRILQKTKTDAEVNINRQDYSHIQIGNLNTGSISKEHTDTVECNNIHESPFKMTRPVTLFYSAGSINPKASRYLIKNNKDFLVVGIIGSQGVGKSTILNILANEQQNCDYFKAVILEKNSYFSTKIKQTKWCSRPRTESTHMFITRDRVILLDSPPVLCNTSKKETISNSLEDLQNVITFLSVCHLVIVIWDDHFNMNFMRLLHFAEIMKTTNDNKAFVPEYFPNILFLKNKAKRDDFSPDAKKNMDCMLSTFFQESRLNIFIGQTCVSQRGAKNLNKQNNELKVNSFVFPFIKDKEEVPYHKPLDEIIGDLRSLVFMTPRIILTSQRCELTESLWFELLKIKQEKPNFFVETFETVCKRQYTRSHTSINNCNENDDINN